MESFFAAAYGYLQRRRSIIPLCPGSTEPNVELLEVDDDTGYSRFTERRPTLAEISDWSTRSGDKANIAQVTGKISGIIGLEIVYGQRGRQTWMDLTGGDDIRTEHAWSDDSIHYYFIAFPIRVAHNV